MRLLSLILLATSVWAAEAAPVAKVIICDPDTVALNAQGKSRPLQRRDSIDEGDTVITGPTGGAQLRFHDGTGISLSAASRYRIDTAKLDPADGNQKRLVAELIEGGLRSVSGLIGKDNPTGYQLKVRQATIGIRGTNFDVALTDDTYIGLQQGGIAIQQLQHQHVVQTVEQPRYVKIAGVQNKSFFSDSEVTWLTDAPAALLANQQSRQALVKKFTGNQSKAFPPLDNMEREQLIEEP